jgi:hypothetical protein
VAFGISLLDDCRHLWIVGQWLVWPLGALCGLTAEADELVRVTMVEDGASVRLKDEHGASCDGMGLCLQCADLMVLPGTGERWRAHLAD